MGPKYPFGALSPGECVLHADWQELYGLKLESTIEISMFIEHFLEIITQQIYNPLATANDWEIITKYGWSYNTTFPCTITGFLTESYGKWSESVATKMIVLESENFLLHISDYLAP